MTSPLGQGTPASKSTTPAPCSGPPLLCSQERLGGGSPSASWAPGPVQRALYHPQGRRACREPQLTEEETEVGGLKQSRGAGGPGGRGPDAGSPTSEAECWVTWPQRSLTSEQNNVG